MAASTDLHGEHDTELHADVIGAEHFLAGDLEQHLARVDERNAEVLAPTHVTACGECFDELAFVVEKTRHAFVDDELVAKVRANHGRDERNRDRADEDVDDDLFGVHSMWVVVVGGCE